MAAIIGNDILDIGSRKARRGLAIGAPGQFDLPNVADVRLLLLSFDDYPCRPFSDPFLTFPFPHFKIYSPPCIVVATLPLFAVLAMKINLSSF
jgi:hypothetical protein